jgi:hypothetical protein
LSHKNGIKFTSKCLPEPPKFGLVGILPLNMVKFKNNFCQVPFRERAVDVSQEPDLDSSLKNSWTLKRRILNGEKENAPS